MLVLGRTVRAPISHLIAYLTCRYQASDPSGPRSTGTPCRQSVHHISYIEEPTILGRLSTVRLWWLIPAAAAFACGGGETLDVRTTGTLQVTTSTTGPEPDPDGYTIQIGDQPSEAIGPAASLEKTGIEAGSYVVQLGGVATNCSVLGENPRTVAIVVGETTPVPFHVICRATTGSVRVAAATTGTSPDPDGYTITLNGNAQGALGTSAEITLESISPGRQSIGLSGVADNCAVQGDNPRNVAIAAASVAALAFSVRCTQPPPVIATIRISTSTTGPDQDEDGYVVSVDGGAEQPIGVTATSTLTNTAAGAHTVALSGITANCSLAGTNPRNITAPAGGVTEVSFVVTCTARPPTLGTLQVNSVTTGPGPYPDSYMVSVDGGPEEPVGPNASLPLADLTPGEHSVALSDIPDNCQLTTDNPASTSVTVGVVSLVTFAITCGEVPGTSGVLTVTTSTTGPDPDPDGYVLAVDGGVPQPVGVNTTMSIASLSAGAHSVSLASVARNCTVDGENPRNLTIIAGDTALVSFAITCVAGAGNLTVTTATSGEGVDPDGYDVSIDGGVPQPIAINGSHTLAGLGVGTYGVTLSGLVSNCQVSGENPRSVTVVASETVTAAFVISCAATTGSLAITISGLSAGTNGAVTVTGPNGYNQLLTQTGILTELTPGTYQVTTARVVVGGITYAAAPEQQTVEVSANATAQVTVGYGPITSASLNLRIDGLYLTQSTQAYTNTVPLVAGRNGYLRVFVLANEPNAASPAVRVRFFRGGTVTRTLNIPASNAATVTSVQEGELALSWNIPVPGSVIETGLSILAEVDPDNGIAESDDADNSFPRSGTPQPLDVRTSSAFAIRFVPVRQRANGLQGNVSESNKGQYLDLTQRIYPLRTINADVHSVYTTTTNVALSSDLSTWSEVLNEIYTLRTVEGSSAYYYGVVNPGPNPTWAGVGYLGAEAAMGYDNVADRSRVTAHELGHNWNREHAPCGNPGGPDPGYPYSGGLIGVFGFDVARTVLRPTYFSDIMGYCADPWVSDYTYKAVLAYRASSTLQASIFQQEQPCLLLWGRIVDGQAVLEPAFQVVTRPKLPSRPGGYRIEGRTLGGGTAFSLSFEPLEVADDPSGSRHFAFAVPLDQVRAAQLESLRLVGPGAAAAIRTRPAAQLRRGAAPEPIRARRTARGVSLEWNATQHPMVMVRDPDTGEVLSFARGGSVEVLTDKKELDVTVSDQVVSHRRRLMVGSP